MERRRAPSSGLGLTHADALQKLKRDLSDVLTELKLALRGDSKDKESAERGADDGEDRNRIVIVKRSPMKISTAIPFDYWSLALLVVSVVLLLVSQVQPAFATTI